MLSSIPKRTHYYCLSKHGTRLAAPSVPLETLLLLTWRGRGPSNSTSPPYLDIHADYVERTYSRLRVAARGTHPTLLTHWVHSFPYERCPTRLSLIRDIGLVVVTQTVADGEYLCAFYEENWTAQPLHRNTSGIQTGSTSCNLSGCCNCKTL